MMLLNRNYINFCEDQIKFYQIFENLENLRKI